MRYLVLILFLAGCAKPVTLKPEPRIDSRIIEAVVQAESKGRADAVSRSRCVGLMQICPSTWRMLGYSRAELFDPEKNIAAGTAYLEMLLDQFGDMHKALAAYNCGPSRWQRCQGYARRVMRAAYE